MDETSLSQHVRIEAAAHYGATLLRNNNGAMVNSEGRLIRFGLGHVKEKQPLRSPDLVGWTPVVITPDMVGKTVAIFTGIELKREGWTHPKDERERAQQKFINLVRASGGLSTFATSVNSVLELLSLTRKR